MAQRKQQAHTQGSKESKEEREVEAHSAPSTPVIYEIVRRFGEEEMRRPALSLWWSGVAAGLSISFSLLAQAVLLLHLPDTPWRPLLVALGFPVGFLMVVLGRQQLFTENTITMVLPFMAEPSVRNLTLLARIWGIVLLANMAGSLAAALFCTFTPVISPEVRESMVRVAQHGVEFGWVELVFRAITAGFLMAAMVWLLPSAEGAQFHVILLITYVIAISGAVHIVTGSMEAFLLVLDGQLAVGTMLGGFMAPVLLGNVIGGTALFALLSYAQVMKEI